MQGLFKSSKLFLSKHASTILTCVGGAGVVATSVMAAKATPKALALVEEAKGKNEELTKLDYVVAALPAYIPAIVTGVSTIACIFGANILNKRAQASLASAYALLNSSYNDYRAKTVELYGDEADDKIKEGVAKDKYAGDRKLKDSDKQLFYDDYSGRYFESTIEDVLQAEYNLNRKMALSGEAFLNDFYNELGLSETEYGNYLGWSAGQLKEMHWNPRVEFGHSKFTFDDGLECTIITLESDPTHNFTEY